MRFASGAKFAVLSFLCVMVFALSMGFALSSLLTRAVQGWEWENTAALADVKSSCGASTPSWPLRDRRRSTSTRESSSRA